MPVKLLDNIFENIPADMPEEIFEILLESKQLTIERIVSCGHVSPETGWYDQDRHEWVILLEGSATIEYMDGSSVSLLQGDYLNIPRHVKHRVTQTSIDPKAVWLAVHYD